MSTYMLLKPKIAHDYWRAIQTTDLQTARAIIRDYDMPLFDYLMKLTGGWNAGLHGALELFGIAKCWFRKPYYSLSDCEMEKLAGFLRGKGLLGG